MIETRIHTVHIEQIKLNDKWFSIVEVYKALAWFKDIGYMDYDKCFTSLDIIQVLREMEFIEVGGTITTFIWCLNKEKEDELTALMNEIQKHIVVENTEEED